MCYCGYCGAWLLVCQIKLPAQDTPIVTIHNPVIINHTLFSTYMHVREVLIVHVYSCMDGCSLKLCYISVRPRASRWSCSINQCMCTYTLLQVINTCTCKWVLFNSGGQCHLYSHTPSYTQGRIELPKAARGHVTPIYCHVNV